MNFASTRLIARDMQAMVAFYELVTDQRADWLAPQFAEIVTASATLAIGAEETVALFAAGSATPCANHSAIIEFRVADVGAEFARLEGRVTMIHPPKLMPWGNRAMQIRDPEGTAVSLFTPETAAAQARFSQR
ncbi:VOC family protein [Thioclava sp. BHET1]|nr:VOC family protein [Thioclava sp. BHET1]